MGNAPTNGNGSAGSGRSALVDAGLSTISTLENMAAMAQGFSAKGVVHMEDKSRSEKIEAVTTQMSQLSSQGIRCATDGSMALCHRSTSPYNYYKARSGIDGGINMDRGGFTLIRPIHGDRVVRIGCVFDGVTAGGKVNAYAAQSFSDNSLVWLTQNWRRFQALFVETLLAAQKQDKPVSSFVTSYTHGLKQLATELFLILQSPELNPGNSNPAHEALGGAATGVISLLLPHPFLSDASLLCGASIGDACAILVTRDIDEGTTLEAEKLRESLRAKASAAAEHGHHHDTSTDSNTARVRSAFPRAQPRVRTVAPSITGPPSLSPLSIVTNATTLQATVNTSSTSSSNLLTNTFSTFSPSSVLRLADWGARQLNHFNRRCTDATDTGGQLETGRAGLNGDVSVFFHSNVQPDDLLVLCTDGLTDNLLHSDVHRVIPLLISLPALDGPISEPCPFDLVGHRGGHTTKRSATDDAKAPVPSTATNIAAAAAAARVGHVSCSPHPPTAEELLDRLWNVVPQRPLPSASSHVTSSSSSLLPPVPSSSSSSSPSRPTKDDSSDNDDTSASQPMVRSISSPQAAAAHAASTEPITIDNGLGVGGLHISGDMASTISSSSSSSSTSASNNATDDPSPSLSSSGTTADLAGSVIDAKIAAAVNSGAFLPFPLLRSTTSFLRAHDLPQPSHKLEVSPSGAPSTTVAAGETKSSHVTAPSSPARPATSTASSSSSPIKSGPPLPSSRPSATSRTVAIQSRVRSESAAARRLNRFSLSSPASLPVATAAVRLYHYVEWITRAQRASQDADYLLEMEMQEKVQAIAAAQRAGTTSVADGNAEIKSLRNALNARASDAERPEYVGKTDDCMMIVMSTRGTGHRIGRHFEDEDYDDDTIYDDNSGTTAASS